MKIFIQSIIIAAAALFLLKACGPFLSGPNPNIGQAAPDFTLESLSGSQKTMNRVRNGRPAVIFFWATWCPHCRRELKDLTRKRGRIERKGIELIIVNVGEGPKKIKAYLDRNDVGFDVLLDKEGDVAGSYKIIGLPTFFFINAEGVVVDTKHEMVPNYEEILLGLIP